MRIVSLVPSLSETVACQGLREALVGCTQFCVEPKDLHRSAKVVGGTKDFDIELIRALKPTHILANQEENPKELILQLQKEFPLLLTFPKSPYDVPAMLRDMDGFLQTQAFEPLAEELEELFRVKTSSPSPRRFLYFIWREPYMLAGRDTYISRFLECFAWENAYAAQERYPAITIDEMKTLGVKTLLMSTEPYPFRKRDALRFREEWGEGCPEIFKIDGRLLSWYGTSTVEAWKLLQAVAEGQPLLSEL
jgi:iron complex transport system substrate-binding protein